MNGDLGSILYADSVEFINQILNQRRCSGSYLKVGVLYKSSASPD